MKIGILGFGYWGTNVTRNFLNQLRVQSVTVFDPDKARRERAKALYPSVNIATDAREILENAEIDAVAVVTPTSTHFELAKAALTNRKHVLVEKPMTATSDEARQLIRLATLGGLQLCVDHTFVYSPAVQKIKELLTAGALGKVWYLDSVRVNFGLFQRDVNVMWDLATHDLAILLHLIGRRPTHISAQGTAHMKKDAEDIVYLTVRYDDSFLAHFHVNWLAPTKIRKTIIGGSEGMVVWDDLDPNEKIKLYDRGVQLVGGGASAKDDLHKLMVKYRTGDVHSPYVEAGEPLSTLTSHFLDCIEGRSRLATDGENGLAVVELLEAAQKSLRSGGALVPIPGPGGH